MKKFKDYLKMIFSMEGLAAALLLSSAIGYGLIQWDLIPDKIPVVGYIDDIVMIVFGFMGLIVVSKKLKIGGQAFGKNLKRHENELLKLSAVRVFAAIGVLVAAAALFSINFIPNALPIVGYLDNIMIAMVGFFGAYRLITRLKKSSRVKAMLGMKKK